MELDVRPIPRTKKHSTIFSTFKELEVGEDFTLVNDHDPLPLRDQFDTNFSRSFVWEYLESGPAVWKIRIAKIASTPLPQILANSADLATTTKTPDVTGVAWKIPISERDLDSNLVVLPPNEKIPSHAGPDLDVMFIVIAGSGHIKTETDSISIRSGDVVWLPKYARREISAGAQGLRYLTIHKHKTGLQISNIAAD